MKTDLVQNQLGCRGVETEFREVYLADNHVSRCKAETSRNTAEDRLICAGKSRGVQQDGLE